MFGYVGMFLYELDAPLAERRAAALSLDSTLLAELLGSEAIRELLDAEVLAEIEASLQRPAPERHVRDVEGTADLLRFLGDLTTAEAAARGVRAEWLAELEPARRVIRVRMAGEERWLAIEDAGPGPRRAGRRPAGRRARDVHRAGGRSAGRPRCSATPAPTGRSRGRARRPGSGSASPSWRGARPPGRLRPAGARRAAPELRPGAGGHRVLRRRGAAPAAAGSLARLRAEVEPVEPRALGRFLPAWQGVGRPQPADRRGRMRRAPGADDVLGVVEQLAGAPLPASALESLILPARLPGYSPALLDELTARARSRWTGCGPLAGGDGWLAVAPADVADLLLPEPEPDTRQHPPAPGAAGGRSTAVAARCSSASSPTRRAAR